MFVFSHPFHVSPGSLLHLGRIIPIQPNSIKFFCMIPGYPADLVVKFFAEIGDFQ